MDAAVHVDGVEFGSLYRDRYTGFEGVATDVWLSTTGQVQVALAYVDTIPKTVWLPVNRLDPVEKRSPGVTT